MVCDGFGRLPTTKNSQLLILIWMSSSPGASGCLSQWPWPIRTVRIGNREIQAFDPSRFLLARGESPPQTKGPHSPLTRRPPEWGSGTPAPGRPQPGPSRGGPSGHRDLPNTRLPRDPGGGGIRKIPPPHDDSRAGRGGSGVGATGGTLQGQPLVAASAVCFASRATPQRKA